jgi:predicted Zn-dependent protease
MKLIRCLAVCLVCATLSACAPGIRFRPGEIPSPGATDPSKLAQGNQFYAQTVAQKPILRDKKAEKRVSSILTKLFEATPTTGDWTVTLIDQPIFNAATTPGNHIFVYRGLLDNLNDDDQVAAVLAHEIGHRLAQHEIETSKETWGKAIAMLATIAAGAAIASQQGSTPRQVNDVMDATNKIGQGFTTYRYSKDKEREADQIGLFLLADAGIPPSAAAALWGGLAAAHGSSGGDFFRTHPLDQERYERAAHLLPLAQIRYEDAIRKKKNPSKKRQPTPPSPTVVYQISQAEQALANNDIPTATAIAQSLTAQAPSSAEAYNILGLVKTRSGETKQATKAFNKGLKLAPENPILIYNMGCMQALQGNRSEALQSLEKAFSLRPSLVTTAHEDPDLVSLRDDPQFTALLEKEYLAPAPTNVGGNSFRVN